MPAELSLKLSLSLERLTHFLHISALKLPSLALLGNSHHALITFPPTTPGAKEHFVFLVLCFSSLPAQVLPFRLELPFSSHQDTVCTFCSEKWVKRPQVFLPLFCLFIQWQLWYERLTLQCRIHVHVPLGEMVSAYWNRFKQMVRGQKSVWKEWGEDIERVLG